MGEGGRRGSALCSLSLTSLATLSPPPPPPPSSPRESNQAAAQPAMMVSAAASPTLKAGRAEEEPRREAEERMGRAGASGLLVLLVLGPAQPHVRHEGGAMMAAMTDVGRAGRGLGERGRVARVLASEREKRSECARERAGQKLPRPFLTTISLLCALLAHQPTVHSPAGSAAARRIGAAACSSASSPPRPRFRLRRRCRAPGGAPNTTAPPPPRATTQPLNPSSRPTQAARGPPSNRPRPAHRARREDVDRGARSGAS